MIAFACTLFASLQALKQTESVMNLEERIAIIKYGKTTMPPQKDVLDVRTIKGLALYIEQFQKGL